MRTLDIQVTKVFEHNQKMMNSEYRYIFNQGGARSSKTYSILQLLLIQALTIPNLNISIVRNTMAALRGAAYTDFINILKDLNIYDKNHHNKSNNLYNFSNGSIVEFFGSDDDKKLRGRKRDICYINEATDLSYEEFMQLDLRTTNKIILDYNPSDNEHWLYKLLERENSTLIKSTYKDNPFLPKEQVKLYDNLINTDYNYYRIYALGERPENNVRIYSHFKTCRELPEGQSFWGLDFGYNDPTALLECRKVDDIIYVRESLYQSRMTTTELITYMKDIGVKGTIWADSSRPEAIQEILLAGYDIRKANKAIKDGIMSVKSREIYITEDSINLLKESKKYSWKTRGEVILDEPVDLDNHACDALRYALHSNLPKSDVNDFISTHKLDIEYKKINY